MRGLALPHRAVSLAALLLCAGDELRPRRRRRRTRRRRGLRGEPWRPATVIARVHSRSGNELQRRVGLRRHLSACIRGPEMSYGRWHARAFRERTSTSSTRADPWWCSVGSFSKQTESSRLPKPQGSTRNSFRKSFQKHPNSEKHPQTLPETPERCGPGLRGPVLRGLLLRRGLLLAQLREEEDALRQHAVGWAPESLPQLPRVLGRVQQHLTGPRGPGRRDSRIHMRSQNDPAETRNSNALSRSHSDAGLVGRASSGEQYLRQSPYVLNFCHQATPHVLKLLLVSEFQVRDASVTRD